MSLNYIFPGPEKTIMQAWILPAGAEAIQLVIVYDPYGKPLLDEIPDYQDFRRDVPS